MLRHTDPQCQGAHIGVVYEVEGGGFYTRAVMGPQYDYHVELFQADMT